MSSGHLPETHASGGAAQAVRQGQTPSSQSSRRRRGFGLGSLFDYQVRKAAHFHSLPFELPVEKYIQETLVGTNGAYNNAPGDKRPSVEHRAIWCRLKRALTKESCHDAIRCLFWISLGLLFHTVSDEAVQDLRTVLAQSWFSLTLEANELLKGSPNMQAHRDDLLDAMPVMFVQVVYRLLVDAFEVERTDFMHKAEHLLEKLLIIIHFEVAGFQMDSLTGKHLRAKIFKRNLVELPFVNQLASTQNEIRRGRIVNQYSAQNGTQRQPLVFGAEAGIALEETQLAHLMELRAFRPPAGSQRRLAVMSMTVPQLKADAMPDRSVKMAGLVDQYQAISEDAEAMLRRHLGDLQRVGIANGTPEECRSEVSTPSSTSEEATPSWRMAITSRFRTSSREASSTGGGGGGRGNKDKKEKEARKRRRQEYVLQQLLKPLPRLEGHRALDTSWVSPVLRQLVPGGGDSRNLLNKGPNEGFHLRMLAASKEHLPAIASKSRSEGSLRSSTRAPSMKHRPSMGTILLPKIGGGPETGAPEGGDLATASPQGAASNAGGGSGNINSEKVKPLPVVKEVVLNSMVPITDPMSTPRKPQPVILQEPPPSLRTDIIRQRLEDEHQAILRNSFETHLQEFNSNTGTKKVRLNPHVLEKNEKAYVQKLQELVGDPTVPALRASKNLVNGRSVGKSSSKASGQAACSPSNSGAENGLEGLSSQPGKLLAGLAQ